MNHFLFNCCSAIGRSFSTVAARAVYGMHLMMPLFQASGKSQSSCTWRTISNTRGEKNS